ncbi:hypothetical protein ACCO45_011909 [Purpureocillium lilacinum]|uniref:Uncharacterized protein n=1 Tax=Purpureocillium lilacinum TaxID=33203 RepID=A0ACC4DCV9_PURLI
MTSSIDAPPMSLTSPKSRVRPNVSTWAVCGGRRSDRQMDGRALAKTPTGDSENAPLGTMADGEVAATARARTWGRLARRANALFVLRIAHLSFSVQVRALTRAGPLLVDGPRTGAAFLNEKCPSGARHRPWPSTT